MKKKVPQSIINKINRMNRLIAQVQQLNQEVEEWVEYAGISDYGFDFVVEYTDSPAYEITWPDQFVRDCNAILAEKRG